MSDLEVLGAVADASQFAGHASKVANLPSDISSAVKDAPHSLKIRCDKVVQLHEVLDLVQNNPRLQTDQVVVSYLHNCVKDAKELQDILSSIFVTAGAGKGEGLWKSFIANTKADKFIGLVSGLEKHKTSLILRLQSINVYGNYTAPANDIQAKVA